MFQHGLALLDVLGEDRVDQLPVDPLVLDRHLAGDDHADDRLAAATAGAAGLVQDDVVAAGGGDVFAELVEHLAAAGGVFAGGRADLDANPDVGRPIVEDFGGLLGQRVKLLGNFGSHAHQYNTPAWQCQTVEHTMGRMVGHTAVVVDADDNLVVELFDSEVARTILQRNLAAGDRIRACAITLWTP